MYVHFVHTPNVPLQILITAKSSSVQTKYCENNSFKSLTSVVMSEHEDTISRHHYRENFNKSS